MTGRKRANILVVLSQIVAQLSLVAVLPVLTRSYDASAIGAFQIATSAAMTIQPLATLRTEFVIPVAKNSFHLIKLGYWSLLIFSGGAILLSVVFAVVFFKGEVAQIGMMTGALVGAFGWTVVDNAVLIRRGELNRLAIRNIIAGTLGATFQVVSAHLSLEVYGLAVSIVVARIFAIGVTRIHTKGNGPKVEAIAGGGSDDPYSARRIVASVASGIVATGTNQSLTIIVGISGSTASSGHMGIAQRAAAAPLTLVGQGLGQVMQARVAPLVRYRRRGLPKVVIRQATALAIVAAVCAAGLMVLAPILAEPILGAGWKPAGILVSILAIPLSFQLVVGPLMTILPLLGKETLLLVVQTARFMLVVGSVVGASIAGLSANAIAMVFGVATVVGYIGMYIVVWSQVRAFEASCAGDEE